MNKLKFLTKNFSMYTTRELALKLGMHPMVVKRNIQRFQIKTTTDVAKQINSKLKDLLEVE